jgi:hypothetical protein
VTYKERVLYESGGSGYSWTGYLSRDGIFELVPNGTDASVFLGIVWKITIRRWNKRATINV